MSGGSYSIKHWRSSVLPPPPLLQAKFWGSVLNARKSTAHNTPNCALLSLTPNSRGLGIVRYGNGPTTGCSRGSGRHRFLSYIWLDLGQVMVWYYDYSMRFFSRAWKLSQDIQDLWSQKFHCSIWPPLDFGLSWHKTSFSWRLATVELVSWLRKEQPCIPVWSRRTDGQSFTN